MSTDETAAGRRRPGISRAAWAGVLATLLVLLATPAAAAVWGYHRLSDAEERLDARSDVVRVAEQFAVSVNNYDATSVKSYEAEVGKLLSTKFRAEFDKAMEDIVSQVEQAEMKSDGEVLASGVATLDDDSARVLVVADAAVETVYDKRDRHFRWEVSLVKVDGRWLVDDFTPVA